MNLQDNSQLQTIVETAPIGICVLDARTLVVEMLNDKFLEIAGKPKEAILGKWYWEPFAEARAYYEGALNGVVETGKSYYADEIELMLIRNGKAEDIVVTFVYCAVPGTQGNISKVAVWVLENTRQIRARQQVANAAVIIGQERDRLRSFLMEAPAGICVLAGPNLVYELVNPRYQTLLPGRQLLGRPVFEALPELVGTPLQQILVDTYITGQSFQVDELLIPVAAGEGGPTVDRWFSFHYQARRNEINEIDGLTAFVIEVTDQVVARKEIEASERHFRYLADLVPAKISNALPTGEVTFFNRQWLDFSGLSFEDTRDFGYHQMMHPDEIAPFQAGLQKAAKNGQPYISEMRFKNTDGEYIWHLNIASPVLDEKGTIKMWVGSTTDIHALKLEEQRRNDFVSFLSHELKTPITSLKGYVQLMQLSIADPNTIVNTDLIEISVGRMDKNVNRFSKLIDEMLDLSRIDHGKLLVKYENTSLNTIVANTANEFRFLHPQYEINLTEETTCFVNADPDKIGQVLTNLLSNAIKYAPDSNKIEVQLFLKDGQFAGVRVTDHGIGIAHSEQARIFDRFYRAQGASQMKDGFGIGLFLAKTIVENHGGYITVDSAKGKGASFSFFIPVVETK